MKLGLTPLEARVLGCLLEKEVTTPEQYPLSLNALTNACNQKSNRSPVLDLDERTVQQVVDGLMKRHVVSDRSPYGGRVTKYKQIFCNTAFGPLKFTDLERAIVCELLVRGPQSAGELRTRCARMAQVTAVDDVETALQSLGAHPEGPFVVTLPRASGARDVRHAHLLGDEPATAPPANAAPEPEPPQPQAAAGLAERVERLEAQLASLSRDVEELKRRPG